MKISRGLEYFYLSMSGVVSAATIIFYKRRLPSLVAHLGDMEIEKITVDHLRAWRSKIISRNSRYGQHPSRPAREGRLSPYTIHQYVRSVRRFFHWLQIEGHINQNPALRLELPQLPKQYRRGISKKDCERMLAIARDNPRDYAIIRFLADTACRVGGIAGLRFSDLELEKRRAVVHEKGRGGNNKSRYVFFTETTATALRAWLSERPEYPGCDHIFVDTRLRNSKRPSDRQLTENGIYQVLKRVAQRAGIVKGYNPHNFRHGAIRGWLNKGMPLSKASELAGHSSSRITGDIYGTSNEDELAAAHDRYTWID